MLCLVIVAFDTTKRGGVGVGIVDDGTPQRRRLVAVISILSIVRLGKLDVLESWMAKTAPMFLKLRVVLVLLAYMGVKTFWTPPSTVYCCTAGIENWAGASSEMVTVLGVTK